MSFCNCMCLELEFSNWKRHSSATLMCYLYNLLHPLINLLMAWLGLANFILLIFTRELEFVLWNCRFDCTQLPLWTWSCCLHVSDCLWITWCWIYLLIWNPSSLKSSFPSLVPPSFLSFSSPTYLAKPRKKFDYAHGGMRRDKIYFNASINFRCPSLKRNLNFM